MFGKNSTLPLYAIAMVAPLLATLLAFGIEHVLHRANISLAYLLAVLIVSVRTSTAPAIVCAIISFLLYNFCFTEPRFTLMMIHREDVLTVSFFLLVAAIAGQQAARLRERVLALQERNHFAKIQFELSQKLATALDAEEVFLALQTSLSVIFSSGYFIAYLKQGELNLFSENIDLTGDEKQAIAQQLGGTSAKQPNLNVDNKYHGLPLHDDKKTIALLGLKTQDGKAPSLEHQTSLSTLGQQAILALGRVALLQDLQKERVDKERELLRSALLSSVSHDLRTPLASMMGATTSLLELEQSLSNNQKRELLESILQESQRLDRYTQNLLDMTRLGHGELPLDRRWAGLDDIISVVVRRVKPLLHSRRLATEMPRELPVLFVHPALIEQALFNVMDNAIKFSPDTTEIALAVTFDHQQITIAVTDQGVGIPPNDRQRVFDMFYTASRGDKHVAGTGLGLAICKGMIGAHGGDVVILDRADGERGTVVRISLPMTERPNET